jgi:hypothetical protein
VEGGIPVRIARTVATLSAAGVLAITIAATASAGGRPYMVHLEGEQERPVIGALDGMGQLSIWVNAGLGEVCYELHVTGIAPAAAAHIHRGPAGQPGPVVVPLTAPTSGMSAGCAEVSRDLAIELLRDPSSFYVNVHNADFPGGALRGQLSR